MLLNLVRLGQIDYPDALDLQNRLLKLRQLDLIEDTLLLLEHPPVITVGTAGKDINILANEDFLKSKGVSVHHISRGGDVTYHGPGQLVGYPILNLRQQDKDVKVFFKKLENTFIELLKHEYRIDAGRDPKYPGVWVGNEKITALGCAVKRWVTMHGFAFNINTNLEHFQWINPCGILDKGVTSLQKILGHAQDMEAITEKTAEYFIQQYGYQSNNVERSVFLDQVERLTQELESREEEQR
ncbi:lipoyl(octanoyl) transferase LipB [Anoxybacterium hadale]|uniref:Lipoyl(Octanoyl) transferase LipB n=1 Tax=Anoxybacterium hadale TaxID=3408580 RepID=A0ACD1AFG6_9FIRM|nr:lipoyl(octanoyl) transferase LipB [Clostridiales bacterium]